MIEQAKLRDVRWRCTNSDLLCPAVFPCFDADGRVKLILVVTQMWGWLVAPTGKAKRDGPDVVFDGPLEELYKVSDKAAGRLAGLLHYDPWWLARDPGSRLSDESVAAIARTNLAGRSYRQLPVNSVFYDDGLLAVEQIEVGSALWRRTLTGPGMKELLAGVLQPGAEGSHGHGAPGHGPSRPAEASGPLTAPHGRDLSMYQAGDGPIRTIASERRVGRGPVVIGPGSGGRIESGPPSKAKPAPPQEAKPPKLVPHELAEPVIPRQGRIREVPVAQTEQPGQAHRAGQDEVSKALEEISRQIRRRTK